MKVYTTGYGGKEPADLLALADSKGIPLLIDIRYVPFSQRRQWSQPALIAAWGDRYCWLKDFGNERHKEGAIQIHDYQRGLVCLKAVAEKTDSCLLFCACWHKAECHRNSLSEYLSKDGFVVKELAWPKIERPEGVYWNREKRREEMDPLAEMEAWAVKHVKRMDDRRTAKLQATRDEFANTERIVLAQMQDGREFVEEEIPTWAALNKLSQLTVRDVLRRLERRKVVEYDWGGTDGHYWHWWVINTKQSTTKKGEQEDASEGTDVGSAVRQDKPKRNRRTGGIDAPDRTDGDSDAATAGDGSGDDGHSRSLSFLAGIGGDNEDTT